MQKPRIAAVLIGGLVLAPLSGALAQDIAYAPPQIPRQYVVFLDSGTNRLSDSAAGTVRSAAVSASAGTTVRLVGRPDHAQVVKTRMVQDGVPAGSIVIVPDSGKPLPMAQDGLKDPANRKVEIKL